MLISPAYAQTAAGLGGQDGALLQFMPLVLIFVVFYFLLIRPQQKRQKQHAETLKALRRSDKIVVAGIHGTVVKLIGDTEVEVEIAPNVRIRVVRAAINEVLTKSEPVPANGDKKGGDAPAQDNSAAEGK